jgi:hypothetical protein
MDKEGTGTAIVKSEGSQVVRGIDGLMAHINSVQEVVSRAMKDGEHYGKLPGVSKNILYKQGAEYLSLRFNWRSEYQVTRYDLDSNHREYEIRCLLYHRETNIVMGEGLGNCSTMESKYRYRRKSRTCPECGMDTIRKSKPQYGGGWYCSKKDGGCGANYEAGDASIEAQEEGRAENPDIADVWNTVLKMAKKRAYVDSVITACGASDLFTQDLEEQGGADRIESSPEIKEAAQEGLAKLSEEEITTFSNIVTEAILLSEIDTCPPDIEGSLKKIVEISLKVWAEGKNPVEFSRAVVKKAKKLISEEQEEKEPTQPENTTKEFHNRNSSSNKGAGKAMAPEGNGDVESLYKKCCAAVKIMSADASKMGPDEASEQKAAIEKAKERNDSDFLQKKLAYFHAKWNGENIEDVSYSEEEEKKEKEKEEERREERGESKEEEEEEEEDLDSNKDQKQLDIF